MHFKVEVEQDAGTNVHVNVFAGEDRNHLDACGRLHFSKEEAVAFLECLNPAHVPLIDTFAVTGVEIFA